jgi:hypothetical protein
MFDFKFTIRKKQFHKTREMTWYRILWARIKTCFSSHRRKKQHRHDQFVGFEEPPAPLNKISVNASGSLDDIPLRTIEMNRNCEDGNANKQPESESELSPMANEPWKEDSKLMLNGQYSRFKTIMNKFSAKYRVTSMIGQGSFGFVLRAERLRDGVGVAVKFIYRPNINTCNWLFDGELGMIPSEVFYLKKMAHVGIVQFLDYFDDGRYVYLVTELHGTSWSPCNPLLNPEKNVGLKQFASTVDGNFSSSDNNPCDLFECIEAHNFLPEKRIHYIFLQLLDIVRYLKTQGILHRDLKDENVVVDADYRIKIVDFGCAARIPIGDGPGEEGYFERFNGTLAFAPPEVIKGLKYRGSEAECWTLGVLLFTMAFRQAPFPDAESILVGHLEFPFEEERPGKEGYCLLLLLFIIYYYFIAIFVHCLNCRNSRLDP